MSQNKKLNHKSKREINKVLVARMAYAKFHEKIVLIISESEVANTRLGINGWYKYGLENYPALFCIAFEVSDPKIMEKMKLYMRLTSKAGFAKFNNRELYCVRITDVKRSSAGIYGWYEYGQKHGGPGLRKCTAKKGCKKYYPIVNFIKKGTNKNKWTWSQVQYKWKVDKLHNKTCRNCLDKCTKRV